MSNPNHHRRLEQLASGYRASQLLFTAVRLGLFESLGRRSMPVAQLAAKLAANPRAVRILCDALLSLGLLDKTGERYANAALAREYLLARAPKSQVALLRHNAQLYDRWGRLGDVVKTGRPFPRESDPRAFAQAMASSAVHGARETAAAVDMSQVRTMLDIGGGPGIYAIELARKQPKLRAVVFDSRPTLEVAKANIARAGLGRRIAVKAGDAFRDDLGSDYDLILLSNVVHVYSDAENRCLLARAAAALAPGGRVCVKDFLFNPGRRGPEHAALFAINMLVNTDRGDCYTLAEIRQWLKAAGLSYAGQIRLSPPSRLVFGRKG